MFCEVRNIMQKNEEYARGWLRLHGQENTSTVISMGQYAVDLCKLKRNHMETCPWCKQSDKQAVQ